MGTGKLKAGEMQTIPLREVKRELPGFGWPGTLADQGEVSGSGLVFLRAHTVASAAATSCQSVNFIPACLIEKG